ncbi:MAG: hypothetical protein K6G51_04070 [Sphaerochaetaceae bacterium]|nr:hypothetical protein [Sphaerochaetaceae bacterium]
MKKVLGISFLLVILVFLPAVKFFTMPVVKINCTGFEKLFLEKLIKNNFVKSYRITFEDDESADYIFTTPIRNMKDGNDNKYTIGSTTFVPDENSMWQTALKYFPNESKSVLLYNANQITQIELAESAPDNFIKYSYEGNISSIQAQVFLQELEKAEVENVIALSPDSSIELLRLLDKTLLTTDMYAIALETKFADLTVGPDYEEMIIRAINEEEGGAVPYIVLPRKQGLKVLFDRFF